MNEESDYSDLVDGYCSGSLSDEDFARLEDALRRDPALRRDLLESRMLESELRQFAWTLEQQDQKPERPASRSRKILQIGAWAAAAAALVLLLGYQTFFPSSEDEPLADSPSIELSPSPAPGLAISIDHGVAVLAREHDARWVDTSPRLGESMPPGRWNLASGMAEIQFYSGASVTLQAPAELEILSENGGILHQGTLRADVPQHAHGFSIKTAAVELIDLGTSFGMSVSDDANTEIHVFEGEVELFKSGIAPQTGTGDLLTAGQGRVFRATGEEASMQVDPALFDGPSQLDRNSSEAHAQWTRSAAQWSLDPRLLARYDFEKIEQSRRGVRANSTLLDPGVLEGVIIGAARGEGRWPQKRSLDFKRPSDRVRVALPGQYDSLTIIASLRIDGLDNYYNSILASDGWDRQGAFHWQLLRNKRVELSVSQGADQAHLQSRAAFVLDPSDMGRWMQLAVSYHRDTGIVRHYQDGILIGEASVDSMVPIDMGAAEIGNWTPPAKQAREIRNFNGRIDEILIFNEALNASEISGYYTGTPLTSYEARRDDSLTHADAPTRVRPGQTVPVSVDYQLDQERQIEVSFTLDTPPWTNFGSAIVTVPAGSGTAEIDIPIDPATPEAKDAYKFEASLLPVGRNFEDRIDSLSKHRVDCLR